MRRWFTAGIILALAMGVGARARAAAPAKFRFWKAADQSFTESSKGVGRATVWGNPDKGDYGSLIKYQAGAVRDWHTHSNPLHLMMISGTLVFEVEGTAPQELGPGDGVTEVPKVPHRATCKEGADCLFLITGAKKYDFKPAKPMHAAK